MAPILDLQALLYVGCGVAALLLLRSPPSPGRRAGQHRGQERTPGRADRTRGSSGGGRRLGEGRLGQAGVGGQGGGLVGALPRQVEVTRPKWP